MKKEDMTRLELKGERLRLQKEILEINHLLDKKGSNSISLEEALRRTYKVSTQSKGALSISCRISLPLCFDGKYVKLKIVDKGELAE